MRVTKTRYFRHQDAANEIWVDKDRDDWVLLSKELGTPNKTVLNTYPVRPFLISRGMERPPVVVFDVPPAYLDGLLTHCREDAMLEDAAGISSRKISAVIKELRLKYLYGYAQIMDDFPETLLGFDEDYDEHVRDFQRYLEELETSYCDEVLFQ